LVFCGYVWVFSVGHTVTKKVGVFIAFSLRHFKQGQKKQVDYNKATLGFSEGMANKKPVETGMQVGVGGGWFPYHWPLPFRTRLLQHRKPPC
jgi:hypothetical protein